jgi:hypothetical protein
MLGRLLRDAQAVRDLRIAESLDEQREHLHLAAGQSRGVDASLADRAARDQARATRAHLPAQPRRGGNGSDLVEQHERLTLCGLIARRECDRLLVRATELSPGSCCIAPGAHEVCLVRGAQSARDFRRWYLDLAQYLQPQGGRSQIPGLALGAGTGLECCAQPLAGARPRQAQPQRFGIDHREWRAAHDVALRGGQ